MAFSAFQSNAFQSNAFQIIRSSVTPSNDVILLGGGPGREREEYVYNPDAFKHQQERLQLQKLAEEHRKLQLLNDEIAEAERKASENNEKLKAKKSAKKLAVLEASLQEEINRLRMERIWLIRRINDDEAILILMMMKRKRIF